MYNYMYANTPLYVRGVTDNRSKTEYSRMCSLVNERAIFSLFRLVLGQLIDHCHKLGSEMRQKTLSQNPNDICYEPG